MQYGVRIVLDRAGLSCNSMLAMFRPRCGLNIAETGDVICGGAEASSSNHLIRLGPDACIASTHTDITILLPSLCTEAGTPSYSAVCLSLNTYWST